MSKYRKFIIAGLGAAVAIADHFAGPGNDISFIVITVATAFGVWATPNAA